MKMKRYAFLILSRNNDANGNPFRLGIVYDMGDNGMIVKAIEARSSSPNFRYEFRNSGIIDLGGFHLSPAEYNELKKSVKSILERGN